jgi:tetratricopeptide (TPR) repeat protein
VADKTINYISEMSKGNFALAISLLDKEISLNPESPELLYNFAICCSRTGNHSKCIQVLNDLLTRFERFIERDNIYRLLIFSYVQLGEFVKSLELTDERLNINVGDLKLLSFRANILEKLGKIDDAIQIHRNILKLKPDYKNSLNSIGYLIASKPNFTDEELAEATDCLKQALKLDANNSAYLDSFGVLLKKKGLNKEALRAFNKALSLDQKHNAEILEHLQDLI